VPKGYVQSGLIKAGQWLYNTLDLRGCRNDDTKGQAIQAVNTWTSETPMSRHPAVGEYAAGDKDSLAWWLSQVRGNNYAFDFEVKYRLRDMCNGGSKWDMTQLQSMGLASKGGYWAARAVTFVENPDSDTNGFGAVVFNKLLAYAFILTAEGWPSVYYRDYAAEKYCYGLKSRLDNLIWIHAKLANGTTSYRHAEYQFVVYERQGWPGLLVGLNNDIWGGWKTVTVQTSCGPNTRLHDYSGSAGDVWTDWQGRVTIGIPPNDNGAGYVCYSRTGLDGALAADGGSTTQLFEGANDLLDGAATAAGTAAGRIWCDANTDISIAKPAGNAVSMDVTDEKGNKIITRGWNGRTRQRGWHQIVAWADKPTPYESYVTYTATAGLKRSECEF
jgi:alpha-amylase